MPGAAGDAQRLRALSTAMAPFADCGHSTWGVGRLERAHSGCTSCSRAAVQTTLKCRTKRPLRPSGAAAYKSPSMMRTSLVAVRGRSMVSGGVYKAGSRVAAVADVEVSPVGQVRVTALWCAHDCGVVFDPEGVRTQVEGCLVWCLPLAR
jgi:CO/xanthine dehydrogenase Mo-binding subunit